MSLITLFCKMCSLRIGEMFKQQDIERRSSFLAFNLTFRGSFGKTVVFYVVICYHESLLGLY